MLEEGSFSLLSIIKRAADLLKANRGTGGINPESKNCQFANADGNKKESVLNGQKVIRNLAHRCRAKDPELLKSNFLWTEHFTRA